MAPPEGCRSDHSQGLPDVSPVFLLNVGIVVLLVRPAASHEHRPLARLEPAQHVVIEKLSALSLSNPSRTKGRLASRSRNASKVATCPRPHCAQLHPGRRVIDR